MIKCTKPLALGCTVLDRKISSWSALEKAQLKAKARRSLSPTRSAALRRPSVNEDHNAYCYNTINESANRLRCLTIILAPPHSLTRAAKLLFGDPPFGELANPGKIQPIQQVSVLVSSSTVRVKESQLPRFVQAEPSPAERGMTLATPVAPLPR
jgi:hypothetical protein